MLLFSHRTVRLPSVSLSQKHDAAVCRPAPFLCMMTHVTTYLNGLFRPARRFTHVSTTSFVHWPTNACLYGAFASTASMDSLTMASTSSPTKMA